MHDQPNLRNRRGPIWILLGAVVFAVVACASFTMLSTAWHDDITTAYTALALAQYPVYGVILAVSARRGVLRRGAVLLVLTHLIAVGAGFGMVGESFRS